MGGSLRLAPLLRGIDLIERSGNLSGNLPTAKEEQAEENDFRACFKNGSCRREEAEECAILGRSPPPHQTVRKLLASRRPWKNDLHSFDMARFLWRRGVREPFFRSSKTPFRSFRTACHVGGYYHRIKRHLQNWGVYPMADDLGCVT